MPPSYDSCRRLLDDLVERDLAGGMLDRNEATTRLQLIDALLFEVLGWDREECVSEERIDGRISDYALGVPARRLIVEAKREGVTFELPAGETQLVLPIRTLLSDPSTDEAMRQALGYAQERGVPFVAIANGHQVVAFVASRQDGIPPLEGRALVFRSLQDMQSAFRTLWDNLSREGVGLGYLHRTLRDVSLPSPPPKLADRIPGYPRYRNRNKLQTDLQIFGELFIEDVARASEEGKETFLRACYSKGGALSQYALISREILKTRYSTLMSTEGEVTIDSATPQEGSPLTAEVVSAALAKRPVVLLGDVGVGKTMFIENLINVEAKDVFGEAITLYVNFLAEPALVEDLSAFVARDMTRQLREKYDIDVEDRAFVTGVYHGDLNRFDRSVLGQLRDVDPQAYERERIRFLGDKVAAVDQHLRASLDHISKAHRKQIVIFLDNVDQRSTEFQEQVYGIAHAMAETWPAAVFVAIRPSTFFASKRRGALAAYQPRVFSIAPPRIDVVLAKRLQYALDQLERTHEFETLPGVQVETEHLSTYLRTLLLSLERSTDLVELVDNLSGGNVRKALDFVQTFIGSGNVDTGKMLERIERTGTFTIEVHQFLRAIMLGDYEDFSPATSVIANLFDLLTPDGRQHFLVPLLVSEIQRAGDLGGQEGFLDAPTVYDFGQRLSFTPTEIGWALERAVANDLLEERPSADTSARPLYRITSIGAYTVHRLPRMFAYLDAVATDTPIVDDVYRERIGDAHAITDRLSRAELFRIYLDKQWSAIDAASEAFDWPALSDGARDDMLNIGRHAGWP